MLESPTISDATASQDERQPLLQASASESSSDEIPSPPPGEMEIALRVAAAMFSFFVMGTHTAAVGVLIPYVEPYYSISDTLISLLFVTPLSGYLLASLSNSTLHARFGRRGIAVIGSVSSLLLTTLLSFHPPYPVVLLAFAAAGFGTGLLDAGWCAWAAGLRGNANTISGFLHGAYSTGATTGPYLTAQLIAGAGLPWYTFYRVMLAVSCVQMVVLAWAFRNDGSAVYGAEKAQKPPSFPSTTGTTTTGKKALYRHRVLYICAAYLTCYMGVEATVSGWLATYMLRERHASPFTASLASSGFWGGMAVGRVTLGSLTDRVGERIAVTGYLACALGAEIAFICLLRPMAAALASISLLGFFLGPVFPTGIVMVTRLLPRGLHVDAVASVNVVGQVGGALFPFIVGVVAERLGIRALMPFVCGMLVLVLGVWRAFPRLPVVPRS